MALGLTPIVLGYGFYVVRKSLGLVEHGVEVIGKALSVRTLGQHGMIVLRYEYEFCNSHYTGAVDVLTDHGRRLLAEGNIRLIVNSKKPSHSDLFESIFPQPRT
jgi:hypothetical protein